MSSSELISVSEKGPRFVLGSICPSGYAPKKFSWVSLINYNMILHNCNGMTWILILTRKRNPLPNPTHKRDPIPYPNRWAMRCLLWVLWMKLIFIMGHTLFVYEVLFSGNRDIIGLHCRSRHCLRTDSSISQVQFHTSNSVNGKLNQYSMRSAVSLVSYSLGSILIQCGAIST